MDQKIAGTYHLLKTKKDTKFELIWPSNEVGNQYDSYFFFKWDFFIFLAILMPNEMKFGVKIGF